MLIVGLASTSVDWWYVGSWFDGKCYDRLWPNGNPRQPTSRTDPQLWVHWSNWIQANLGHELSRFWNVTPKKIKDIGRISPTNIGDSSGNMRAIPGQWSVTETYWIYSQQQSYRQKRWTFLYSQQNIKQSKYGYSQQWNRWQWLYSRNMCGWSTNNNDCDPTIAAKHSKVRNHYQSWSIMNTHD